MEKIPHFKRPQKRSTQRCTMMKVFRSPRTFTKIEGR